MRTHWVVDAQTGHAEAVPFTAEEEAAADAAAEAQAVAAGSPSAHPLSDRQLRIGLIMAGFDLANIQAAIDAIPDAAQRAVAQVWWDRSILIHWEHPMTQNLIGLVGLTPEQASAMWMAAKDLEA